MHLGGEIFGLRVCKVPVSLYMESGDDHGDSICPCISRLRLGGETFGVPG